MAVREPDRGRVPASLTNKLTKLYFAGMSDGTGLHYVSRLLGEEPVPSQPAHTLESDSPVATVPLVPSARSAGCTAATRF